jgi:putative FmdB family regulatory protein
MPTYEYVCDKNKEHKYTEVRSIHADQQQTTCAANGCDGKLNQIVSAPPIIFKGSGFSSNRG